MDVGRPVGMELVLCLPGLVGLTAEPLVEWAEGVADGCMLAPGDGACEGIGAGCAGDEP